MEKEEAMAKTAGEAKPATAAGAGRPRTRLVRVDQFIIDFMLRQPPARPFPVFSDEAFDRLGMPGFRALMERAAATMKSVNDREADILHQYRTKGYAEVEETLSDDEEVAAMPVQEDKKKKKKKKEKKKKKQQQQQKKKDKEEEVRDRPTEMTSLEEVAK
ncbi:hypothetical protein PVAP13_3KG552900 [Panicum virgatum]|uniref:Uncharacterized protein n=1 Tax=Panicum virgatum TaxID=38727 RepID=A0A8T0V8C7_PANVG|nr:hypothetical protein PVAP13_3KG552900 [Panicum virgatum]